MNKVPIVYHAPATGLAPSYTIIGVNGIVQAATSDGVTEPVAGTGVYVAWVDRHKLVEQNTVVIWNPNNGALGASEGPWDKVDS